MSNPEILPPGAGQDSGDEPSSGPSLALLWGLLAAALLLAIGIATLIVLPFYHRR